jgi:excisionase family DNA binding protein
MDSLEPRFRRTKVVAEMLDCSRKTVVLWIRRGELEAIRVGRREFRVADEAIKAFVNSRRYTIGRRPKKRAIPRG